MLCKIQVGTQTGRALDIVRCKGTGRKLKKLEKIKNYKRIIFKKKMVKGSLECRLIAHEHFMFMTGTEPEINLIKKTENISGIVNE